IPGQLHGCLGPGQRGEGAIGHHVTIAATDVIFVEILGLEAEGGVGLDKHPFDAPAIDEIVDIGAAPRGRDRGIDLREIQPQRTRLVLIDIDLELRRILQRHRSHLGQPLVLHRHAEQHVAHLHELLMSHADLVDQLQIEPGRIAQFLHGGRDDREN
ncbi:hypothetical protein BLX88_23930, partial [Bacillus obstructivus]